MATTWQKHSNEPVCLVGAVDQQNLRKSLVHLPHVLRAHCDDSAVASDVFIDGRNVTRSFELETHQQFCNQIFVR
jgi:hypothetical protein